MQGGRTGISQGLPGNLKLLRLFAGPLLGIAHARGPAIFEATRTPFTPMDTPVSALIERKGRAVHVVPSTVTIAEAVAEMNKRRIGCIVIVDEGALSGIFTERDVLSRVVGADIDVKTVLIADVMTKNVQTIRPETTVEETMKIFAEKYCRHLPVMDGGQMKGLISIGDISRWVAETSRAEADHLKNYIAGGFPA